MCEIALQHIPETLYRALARATVKPKDQLYEELKRTLAGAREEDLRKVPVFSGR